MADFIQSKVYLIHRVEPAKPTTPQSPTKPLPPNADGTPQKATTPPTDTEIEKKTRDGVERIMGKVSLQRRIMNTTLQTAAKVANTMYDRASFNEQFIGNTRGAAIIQNYKEQTNKAIQFTTSLAGATITTVALGNPAIAGVWLAGQLINATMDFVNKSIQIEQYNRELTKTLYESQYTRDRLAINTYNRRKV